MALEISNKFDREMSHFAMEFDVRCDVIVQNLVVQIGICIEQVLWICHIGALGLNSPVINTLSCHRLHFGNNNDGIIYGPTGV